MPANTNNMNNPNNMTNQNNIHNNFGNNENYTNEINNLFNMFNSSRYKKGVNAYSSYLIIGCFLTPSEYEAFYLNELLGKSLSQFSSSNQGSQGQSQINPQMMQSGVPMMGAVVPMEINYISPSELEEILSKILGTKTSEE